MKLFSILALVVVLSTSLFMYSNEKNEVVRPKYSIKVISQGETWGEITLETFPDVAPLHAANFDSLVVNKAYDGCAFHRVIPGFVIQGGDPNSISGPRSSWGMGNPNQKRVPAEFSDLPHKRGILSAARSSDPNSATSQFFICVDNAFSLNNNYTVYGQVLTGMEIVDKIVKSKRDKNDNPIEKIEMYITKL